MRPSCVCLQVLYRDLRPDRGGGWVHLPCEGVVVGYRPPTLRNGIMFYGWGYLLDRLADWLVKFCKDR